MSILIESTFLQIYANLEESLYYECEHQLIKKKASLSRFEIPLAELGYSIDNEHWHALINLSKIRNCLLHGNGRIDSDHYGLDTREIINTINSDAGIDLIDIIASPLQKDSFTIRIKAPFLHYCLTKIKGFIGA